MSIFRDISSTPLLQAKSDDQTNNPRLKFALTYASQMGWAVFPVPVGTKASHKKAEYCNGVRWGATRNPDQIMKDFNKWPDANVGIPCGKDNGFFVVEIDTPKGHNVDGFASLAQLEDRYCKLPATMQAMSPSGSLHFYFNYPPDMEVGNSTSCIGDGIDVRGEGGMVVAPFSIKPGVGVYRWKKIAPKQIAPIVDAPDWLLELIWRDEPTPLTDIECTTIWSNEDISRVGAALQKISADCSYRVWFEILTALKNVFGDAASGLARAWSATSPTKYSSKGFDSQWSSIKRGQYRFSLATIYYYAS
jgi:hypothetical protein